MTRGFMKDKLLKTITKFVPVLASVFVCILAFGVVSDSSLLVAPVQAFPISTISGIHAPPVEQSDATHTIICQSKGFLVSNFETTSSRYPEFPELVWVEGYAECAGMVGGDQVRVITKLIDVGLLKESVQIQCGAVDRCPLGLPNNNTGPWDPIALVAYWGRVDVQVHLAGWEANRWESLYPAPLGDGPNETECFPGRIKFSSNAGTGQYAFVAERRYLLFSEGTWVSDWAKNNLAVYIGDIINPGGGQLQVTIEATEISNPNGGRISLGHAEGVGEDPDFTVDTTGPIISTPGTYVLEGNGSSPWPGGTKAFFKISTNTLFSYGFYNIKMVVWDPGAGGVPNVILFDSLGW